MGVIMADEPLRTAVALARAENGLAEREQQEQQELFAAIADAEAMPGPLSGMPTKRGRGRPKGSRNRRTEAITDVIRATRRDPLLVLADMAEADVSELASYLECSRLEAAKLQAAAARELAPYLHSKQPVAVAATGGDVVVMVGSFGEPSAQGASGGQDEGILDLSWTEAENAENQ
jgi:hypothetical protein